MAKTAIKTHPTASRKPAQKFVYDFEEGGADMRALLGGKGAGVAEMTKAGMPVPPGFTITTQACLTYLRSGGFAAGMLEEVRQHLGGLEERAGKRLGDRANPLLVSVRSGAAFSMPGMMDTVLNLGLNRETLEGLAQRTGDRRFALDAYRRFIQMYGRIVLGIEAELFDTELEQAKKSAKVSSDAELSPALLEKLSDRFRAIVEEHTKQPFPEDPWDQLTRAIAAVFDSWNGRRAIAYREFNHIPNDLGTAVNIQAMVFGNMGSDSGTGVAFTRDPATGERRIFGE
ncbi:MAG: PEP/pyruvate-binding domain-containing protein, partial [Candidatus Dormibacteria bacterium]